MQQFSIGWSAYEVLQLSCIPKTSIAQMHSLILGYSTFNEAIDSLGILANIYTDEAQKRLEHATKNNVRIVTIVESDYPTRLCALENPPIVLYVQGVLPKPLTPSIAVVGTRTCSAMYGKPVTEFCVLEWTLRGCAIVSGLANGIDTIAHNKCVDAGGCTVAVIASGIDRITPTTAKRCAQEIVASGGSIVSEYPCGVAAMPAYFPARNRIISALSDVVVVVESKATGGALITAQFAKKLGIPVFALPGNITSSRSTGTNALIARGDAILLESPEQIFCHPSAPSILLHYNSQNRLALAHQTLSPLEMKILDTLEGNQLSIEALADALSTTTNQLRSTLLSMEFSGYLQHHPGGRFSVLAKHS